MPVLDLSTKKSFIIYQQGAIESQYKIAKNTKILTRRASKTKGLITERESKHANTPPDIHKTVD